MSKFLAPYVLATDLSKGPGIIPRGGCIRFDPSGVPYLHVNSAHIAMGILKDSVCINDSGDLEFQLDVSLPVVRVWTVADETLTMRGITGGLSGGAKLCTVRFRQDGMGLNSKLWLTNEEHYDKIEGEYANLWFGIDSYWDGEPL